MNPIGFCCCKSRNDIGPLVGRLAQIFGSIPTGPPPRDQRPACEPEDTELAKDDDGDESAVEFKLKRLPETYT